MAQACSISSAFVVKDARLEQEDAHRRYVKIPDEARWQDEFYVTGHRVAEGSGTVIAFRTGGRIPLLVDQGSFQKITLFLPGRIEGVGRYQVSREGDEIAFMSWGPSEFPGKAGCLGYATDGWVEYAERSAGRWRMEVALAFETIGPGNTSECGKKSVRRTAVIAERALRDLSPWEGRRGPHIYDEAHP